MQQKSLFSDQAYVEKVLLEEQKSADYDIKEYPVEVLVAKLDKKDIVIPDYQREFIWLPDRQSKLIESILIGLPIPYLFAADLPDTGFLEVIDGVQRLTTLSVYLKDQLVLTGLEKLGFLNETRFSDLPPSQQRRFKARSLRMIVLKESADQDIRFDIFERINTGSLNATPAELRRGAYPGEFYNLVKECADSPLFEKVCPLPPAKKDRREGEELALRFFAYADQYKSFDHDVAKFLNRYLRTRNENKLPSSTKQSLKKSFDRMLTFVSQHLPNGFAKTAGATSVPRVRFEAISVGIHLAIEQKPALKPKDVAWLESEQFRKLTTTDASNSGPKLRARIEYVRDCLLGKQP